MTLNIDKSPAKEEVAGSRPYDEADGEDKCKMQTVRPIRPRLCPSNPCNNQNVDGWYPGHGEQMIEIMDSLDPYYKNKQEQEQWDYDYVDNNVGDCENTQN